MTQPPHEQPAQTDQIPLLTHGSAELLTSAHQRGFPHQDTQCSGRQKEEALQADSLVEEADSLVEEEADPQEEDSSEDLPLNKEEIRTQETD